MDAYTLALIQARKELEEAKQQFKIYSLRVSQLESFVAQAEALTTAMLPPASPSLFEEKKLSTQAALLVTPEDQGGQIPLWRAIINSLNEKKSSFSVPDAIAALARTGRHIESENRLSIVRNALKQKPDKFKRIAVGVYCVIGFEVNAGEGTKEKEDSSEEKTS
jgi:hypothetical protein